MLEGRRRSLFRQSEVQKCFGTNCAVCGRQQAIYAFFSPLKPEELSLSLYFFRPKLFLLQLHLTHSRSSKYKMRISWRVGIIYNIPSWITVSWMWLQWPPDASSNKTRPFKPDSWIVFNEKSWNLLFLLFFVVFCQALPGSDHSVAVCKCLTNQWVWLYDIEGGWKWEKWGGQANGNSNVSTNTAKIKAENQTCSLPSLLSQTKKIVSRVLNQLWQSTLEHSN